METIQIRLSEEQINEIDEAVKRGAYQSRSEAIRAKLREFESIKETIEIMKDEDLVNSIKRGIADLERGDKISFFEIKKKYGIN